MALVQTVNRGDAGLNRSVTVAMPGRTAVKPCSSVVLPGWTVVIRVGTVLHQGRWSSVAIFNKI